MYLQICLIFCRNNVTFTENLYNIKQKNAQIKVENSCLKWCACSVCGNIYLFYLFHVCSCWTVFVLLCSLWVTASGPLQSFQINK